MRPPVRISSRGRKAHESDLENGASHSEIFGDIFGYRYHGRIFISRLDNSIKPVDLYMQTGDTIMVALFSPWGNEASQATGRNSGSIA
jgi:hypothetical protein